VSSSRLLAEELAGINRYLDREYVRRLANTTLRIYAHTLLHFVRWWESVHHIGDVRENDLTESTLLDYLRSSPANNPGLPLPPSMTASPSPSAHSQTSSPMLPARSPVVFIKAFCGEGQWVSAGGK